MPPHPGIEIRIRINDDVVFLANSDVLHAAAKLVAYQDPALEWIDVVGPVLPMVLPAAYRVEIRPVMLTEAPDD